MARRRKRSRRGRQAKRPAKFRLTDNGKAVAAGAIAGGLTYRYTKNPGVAAAVGFGAYSNSRAASRRNKALSAAQLRQRRQAARSRRRR